MTHYAIGYAMNGSLLGVTEDDARKLTHFNLAFGLIKDGLLDLAMLSHIDTIRQFRAWNPALRIVLSVGGWGAGGFSTMAMTDTGRHAFAQSCLAAVEQYGLDGIDIDWEYPCSDMAGIDAGPRDRENYTLLLRTLREVLGPERILSVAVGASENFIAWTEMDKVAALVDYVQLMTYDMRNGFSPQAGHHAALSPSRGDDTRANARAVVELFHDAGVPYEKMILGAAFYSRCYPGLTELVPGKPLSDVPGPFGPSFGELTEQFCRENGYKEYWDSDAEAAYLWNGDTFITYESAEAIRHKCQYVKAKGLLGLMYWEHGADPTRQLLSVIADTL